MTGDHRRLLADAEWLAHRYAPDADQIQFRRVTRAEHRAATFITDDYLGQAKEIVALPRTEALAAAPPTAPVHFIFHSAFCCSTLIARALDREGIVMGLKEPVILNDISGMHLRGADRTRVMERLDGALTLLARPFSPGEHVVIKPSNVTNALAPAMLTLRPEARALVLFAPLRTFLGSIARKGMDGRLWVRELVMKLMKTGIVDLGFSNEDHFQHTDLQAAAVGWLAQHMLFMRMVGQFGANRIRSIDSEALLGSPAKSIAALTAHYGIAASVRQLDAMASGPAFATHSKSGESFGRRERHLEASAGVAPHADEIEKVAVWAEAVARHAGFPIVLPAPLIS